jgi:hypothetical protein
MTADYGALDEPVPARAVDAMLASARQRREDVQRVLYHVISRWDAFGDSELFRDAIRIGRQALQENDWWPPPIDGSPAA